MSMPDTPDALGRLLAGLNNANGPVVIIDDRSWSAADILSLAEKWGSEIGKDEKIACLADNPAIIAASLVAAGRSNSDILLVRDRTLASPEYSNHMGITAVIDANGELTTTGNAHKTGQGHVQLMTSGTTGKPKITTHRLSALLERIAPYNDNDPAARWLLTYHSASFAGLQVLLTALVSGVTLVATAQPTIASLTALAIQHKITFASGTPTFWRSFLTACGEKTDTIPLRIITLGGETADQPTLDRLHTSWPAAKLVHIYASTEGGVVFAVKDGRAGFPASWLNSIVDGYQLRLNNGMLEINGPRMMQKYESTELASPLHDGWLQTGDLCAVGGDRVYFIGRQDSIINVGGVKVVPEAVEASLLQLPLIQDIRVFGRRNPVTGMLVAADIVLSNSSEDPQSARKAVLDHARKVLQPFEVPQIMNFVPHLTETAGAKKARQ